MVGEGEMERGEGRKRIFCKYPQPVGSSPSNILDLKFARETLDQMDSPRASATYKCPSNVSPAGEWFLSIDISPPGKVIHPFYLMSVFLLTIGVSLLNFSSSKMFLPLFYPGDLICIIHLNTFPLK
jgi:hypothetical protein